MRCNAMLPTERRRGGWHVLGVEVELSVGAGQGRRACGKTAGTSLYAVWSWELRTNRQGAWMSLG